MRNVTLLIVTSQIDAGPVAVTDDHSPTQRSCPKCGSSDVRRSQSEGAQQLEINITGVTADQPFPAGIFDLPPEIKTLVDKAAGK